MIVRQRYAAKVGGGTYPTWLRRTEGEKWLNNTVHTVRLMLDFAMSIPDR